MGGASPYSGWVLLIVKSGARSGWGSVFTPSKMIGAQLICLL